MRYSIAIERGLDGVVRVVDALLHVQARGDDVVHESDDLAEVEHVLAQIAKRSVEGDGWVLGRYWTGSGRDVGDMRHRCRVLVARRRAERGAAA